MSGTIVYHHYIYFAAAAAAVVVLTAAMLCVYTGEGQQQCTVVAEPGAEQPGGRALDACGPAPAVRHAGHGLCPVLSLSASPHLLCCLPLVLVVAFPCPAFHCISSSPLLHFPCVTCMHL